MTIPRVPQRTTPGFSFSGVERALLDCIADRRFSSDEIQEVLAFFGPGEPTCVFCGGPVERWDHLVPVSEGGDTVIGNMVPACAKCDDSKRHILFADWMKCGVPGSPTSRGVGDVDTRLARIGEYVAKYDYQPLKPAERLNPEQRRQFEELRSRLMCLKNDCNAFIKEYRGQQGSG